MSRMIGFRLDPDNPREAQALMILEHMQEAGYSTRHVITEALLALEASTEDEQQVLASLSEVSRRMEQIRDALEGLRQTNLVPIQPRSGPVEEAVLAESFLISVKNAAKPGLIMGGR